MIDFTKIQLSSSASSNKVLKDGFGQLVVAALPGAGETFTTVTVSHNFGSDNLLSQVTTVGGVTDGVILPWESNDGRLLQYTQIDTNSLYITVRSQDSSGLGAPSFSISYYYRILIP